MLRVLDVINTVKQTNGWINIDIDASAFLTENRTERWFKSQKKNECGSNGRLRATHKTDRHELVLFRFSTVKKKAFQTREGPLKIYAFKSVRRLPRSVPEVRGYLDLHKEI